MKVNISASLKQYVLVFLVNLSILAGGMSMSWTSPILVKLNNETLTPLDRVITTEEGSWIVSIGFLGGIFTNCLIGFSMDILGRKYTLILMSLIKIVAGILFIFASRVWMIIFGQALMMLPNAAVFTVVPVYASEVSSKERRGALGTILQIMSSVGIVIVLSVGPFVSYVVLNILLVVIICIATVPLLFIPDTPYFHYSKGRNDEAINLLKFLRGSELLAKEELEEYANTKNDVNLNKIDMLKDRKFLKSLGLGILICGGGQLVGFNAVSFYLQTILESTNTNVKSEIASVIIGLIQLFASFCTALCTDKFGRRQILITSLIGMFLGMFGLGLFFKLTTETSAVVGVLNYLPITSLILIVFCYSAGLGSLMWTLTAEFFDGPTRAFGVSVSLSTSMLVIFFTSKYFAMMTIALGPAITYWIFSANCAIMCLLVALFIPETKGKAFSEIQLALEGKASSREK